MWGYQDVFQHSNGGLNMARNRSTREIRALSGTLKRRATCVCFRDLLHQSYLWCTASIRLLEALCDLDVMHTLFEESCTCI